MQTVTTEDLRQRLDAGPVALFDVRGDVEYEMGHIPGAKSAPMGSLTFRVASVMNPDSYVALYSGGGDCRLAFEAAERLEGLKLSNVHVYEDGLDGWRQSDLPVIASVDAKVITQGPVKECRPVVVDRETSHSGAFKGEPTAVEGAGG